MPGNKIAIIGTVGIPASYGGFETLVENLIQHHHTSSRQEKITVYCSKASYPGQKERYLSATLKYIPLKANGLQSIPYDILSLLSAIRNQNHVILLLGVSGAIALPFIRAISTAHIITNIDGIEWRRQKWTGPAKWFLRFSEKIAVRYSHAVISDNAAIADYVKDHYGIASHVIAYGGDHAVNIKPKPIDEYHLPQTYALSICRIEPENNIEMIVKAFAQEPHQPLVLIGNWENSDYGKSIRARYKIHTHLFLLDPIYDLGILRSIRAQSSIYVHGHSAGGTNPSLVEAMHFGIVIWAFDCSYNRETTKHKATYFNSAEQLAKLITNQDTESAKIIGQNMHQIAISKYTWEKIAEQYFSLMNDRNGQQNSAGN